MIRNRLAGLVAGFAFAFAFAFAPAQAQSSSGNIVGNAVMGETIVVDGPDNGFHREIRIKKDGKFTTFGAAGEHDPFEFWIPKGNILYIRARREGADRGER